MSGSPSDAIMGESLGAIWADRRDRGRILHVDTAACGRTSHRVRERVAAHLGAESVDGGYVAEDAAAGELLQARVVLGELLGFDAQDVAFVESGSAALAQLLTSWPVRPDDVVWVAPSEWGPNLGAFDDHALRVEFLDVDETGIVDPDLLARRLTRRRPALVHLTAVAAHRALAQPVGAIAQVCSRFEVPVIADTAQALGHMPLECDTTAAMYGTGRKYLCGPRGVGYLAVRDPWQRRLLPRAPALAAHRWAGDTRPVRRLESREASIGGRLGLAVALDEYLGLGKEPIMRRLREVGGALRLALANSPRWRLRDDLDAPGAIVSLVPDGVDVARARRELLKNGLLSTAALPERAPHDMTGPLLRLSPHIDLTTTDIDAIARVLHDVTQAL